MPTTMPPPIGSNFRGLSVPEATGTAMATAQPFNQAAAGIQQGMEQKRQTAQFQQLLQKGLEGVGSYVQEVGSTNPELGAQFAAEFQSVAPFIQSLDREKAADVVLSLYESFDGRLKEAGKPIETKPYQPGTREEYFKDYEEKKRLDAQHRPPKPGKADKAADAAKTALTNIPRVWMEIEAQMSSAKPDKYGNLDLSQNGQITSLVSQLHKYETDAKMDLTNFDYGLSTGRSLESGGPLPTMAMIMTKPSRSYKLYKGHAETGTNIPAATEEASKPQPELDAKSKALVSQIEAHIAANPNDTRIPEWNAKIAKLKELGALNK